MVRKPVCFCRNERRLLAARRYAELFCAFLESCFLSTTRWPFGKSPKWWEWGKILDNLQYFFFFLLPRLLFHLVCCLVSVVSCCDEQAQILDRRPQWKCFSYGWAAESLVAVLQGFFRRFQCFVKSCPLHQLNGENLLLFWSLNLGFELPVMCFRLAAARPKLFLVCMQCLYRI